MARLVFVHGVSTRLGAPYEAALALRHRRFRQDTFPGQTVAFFDPYWGNFGVAQQAFATIPDPARPDPDWAAAPLQARSSSALLERARTDPAGVLAAVSILCASLAADRDDAALAAIGDEISDLAGNASRLQAPMFLKGCRDDQELMRRIFEMAAAGLAAPLAKAVPTSYSDRLLDEILIRLARRLSAPVGVFTGDVLHYMRCGPARRGMRAAVHRALVEAGRAKGDGPLVVVGYSLGAVIAYELLADETVVRQIEAETGRAFRVDFFLTVGAPLGFFREINMVPAAPAGMTGPQGLVRRWSNLYARHDVLGFRCRPVFAAAEDHELDLDAGIVDAHTSYFQDRRLYRRLGARLSDSVMSG